MIKVVHIENFLFSGLGRDLLRGPHSRHVTEFVRGHVYWPCSVNSRACANSVYRALLSPPLEPGNEARVMSNILRDRGIIQVELAKSYWQVYIQVRAPELDVPSVIQEFVNSSHPFLTPPNSH